MADGGPKVGGKQSKLSLQDIKYTRKYIENKKKGMSGGGRGACNDRAEIEREVYTKEGKVRERGGSAK